ncbi:MAG: hypothetical protein Q7T50_00120 [Candidatus Magasanikbacteria bacterium]|nr:hypothetical protein [Candidatus Magasanikbacteria bacterium]
MTDEKSKEILDILYIIENRERELIENIAMLINFRVDLFMLDSQNPSIGEIPQETVARFRKDYGTLGYDRVLVDIIKIVQKEEKRQIKEREKLLKIQKR